MPDNRDDSGIGSLFRAAFYGAPIGVGAYYTYQNIRENEATLFGQSPSNLSHQQASETIKAFTQKYRDQGAFMRPWQIEKIEQMGENLAFSADELKHYWLRATDYADPTGNVSNIMREQMAGMTSGDEIFESISHKLRTNSSPYYTKAASYFLEEAPFYHERLMAGESVDLVSRTAGMPKLITPGGTISDSLAADISKFQTAAFGEALDEQDKRLRSRRFLRPDMPGASRIEVPFRVKGFDEIFKLNIPGVLADNPNIVTSGPTLQTRSIVGQYALFDEQGKLASTLNHEEYMMRRAQEGLVLELQHAKRKSDVWRAITAFESEYRKPLQYVSSLSEGFSQSTDITTQYRSNILRAIQMEGGELGDPITDPIDYRRILSQEYQGQELFLSDSPSQVSKGVFQIGDPRGRSALFPNLTDPARRPGQWLRPGYDMSEMAKNAMESDPMQQRHMWHSVKGPQIPFKKVAYVTDDILAAHNISLADFGVTGEGSSLLKPNVSDQWIETKDIKLRGDVSPELSVLMKGEDILSNYPSYRNLGKLGAGTWLGNDFESGLPTILDQETEILEARYHNTKGGADYLQLSVRKRIDSIAGKVFGGDKAMQRYMDTPTERSQFDAILRKIGAPEDVDALVHMDTLRKNQHLYHEQMFASLQDAIKANLQSGKKMGHLAHKFSYDPLDFISRIPQTEMDVTSTAWRLATQEAYLPEKDLLNIFGGVREMYGKGWEKYLPGIPDQFAAKLEKTNLAIGRTQFAFGGPVGPGAGKRAAIEPRGFELMASPHFGKFGTEMQEELARRMILANPDIIYQQQILSEGLGATLSAIDKQKMSIAGGVSGTELASEIAVGGSYLPSENRVLSVKEFGDIPIPGEGVIKQLTGRATEAEGLGSTIYSDLAREYKNVIDAARNLETGKGSPVAMKESLEALSVELARQQVGTVSAKGGLARGKIPGSISLTGLTTVGDEAAQLADEWTIGISRQKAEKVIDEMRQLATTAAERKQVEILGNRMLSGLEAVPGMAGRSPFISPYSTPVVKYQVLPGLKGDYAVFKQAELKGKIRSAGFTENLGKILWSPAVGMAGDFDADNYSFWLAGPHLEKQALQHLTDPEQIKWREEYMLRRQMLKPKAATTHTVQSLTQKWIDKQLKEEAAIKMAAPETMLPKYSNEVARARAAVLLDKGLDKRTSFNALQLLDILEQTPIAGKHLAIGQAEKFITDMSQLTQAFRGNKAGDVSSVFRDMMTRAGVEESRLNNLLLGTQQFEVDLTRAGGEQFTVKGQGIALESTMKAVMKSKRRMAETRVGELSAAQLREIMLSKQKMTPEIARYIGADEFSKLSQYSAFIPSTQYNKGSMAKFSSGIISAQNKAMAAGEKILKHAKPLGIGTGAAIGLAMLLSTPEDTLGPMEPPPRANMESGSGGTHVTPESMMQRNVEGSPTAPSMVSVPNKARISAGHDVKARGNAPMPVDYGRMNSAVNQSLRTPSRVHTSITDRRSTLTAQNLSDILNDE